MEIREKLSIESLPNEEWKDVVGYEGLYLISNFGRLKRTYKNGNEKLLKFHFDKDGYLFTIVCRKQEKSNKKQHRLIAEAFIPNPNNKPEIDHVNGIKDDNRIENLRWCNRIENRNNPVSRDRYARARKGRHINIPNKCILNLRRDTRKCVQIDNGVFLKEFDSITEASKETGIPRTSINSCVRGRRKSAGGFTWKYKEDYERSNN